jgi:hypothetical protein
VTNVIVVIRQRLLTHTDLPPAGTGVLLAVKRESRGQSERQRLANRAWVQFSVHVQSESEGGIVRVASKTGDTVILLGVDRGDREGVFEEERVGHDEGCDRWLFGLWMGICVEWFIHRLSYSSYCRYKGVQWLVGGPRLVKRRVGVGGGEVDRRIEAFFFCRLFGPADNDSVGLTSTACS